MDFNPYGGEGAHLAAALVNFSGDSVAELRELLESFGLGGFTVTDADVDRVRDWAAGLATVFGEDSTGTKITMINDLLERAASRPFISTHDGRLPHLHYAPDVENLVNRLRAYTAVGVAVVLCDSGAHRLGRCRAAGCDVVYVDTSKNGRRRFCSTRCANRTNVAAHRARKPVGWR